MQSTVRQHRDEHVHVPAERREAQKKPQRHRHGRGAPQVAEQPQVGPVGLLGRFAPVGRLGLLGPVGLLGRLVPVDRSRGTRPHAGGWRHAEHQQCSQRRRRSVPREASPRRRPGQQQRSQRAPEDASRGHHRGVQTGRALQPAHAHHVTNEGPASAECPPLRPRPAQRSPCTETTEGRRSPSRPLRPPARPPQRPSRTGSPSAGACGPPRSANTPANGANTTEEPARTAVAKPTDSAAPVISYTSHNSAIRWVHTPAPCRNCAPT